MPSSSFNMNFAKSWICLLCLAYVIHNLTVASTESVSVNNLMNLTNTTALKPIFFMHGISDNEHAVNTIQGVIKSLYPDTIVVGIPLFDDAPNVKHFPPTGGSFTALPTQVSGIINFIKSYISSHNTNHDFDEGYHLICHSLGALTCRVVIQSWPDHQVDTFISLAGPQQGEYGPYDFLQKYKFVVPEVYLVLYTKIAQSTCSVANFWHDEGHRSAYLQTTFLPNVNCDNLTNECKTGIYRTNFSKLKRAAFFGSSADNQILPWYSSHFDFFSTDSVTRKNLTTNDALWTNDGLGLKALSDEGKLVFIEVDNVDHVNWAYSADIIRKYVLPQLLITASLSNQHIHNDYRYLMLNLDENIVNQSDSPSYLHYKLDPEMDYKLRGST